MMALHEGVELVKKAQQILSLWDKGMIVVLSERHQTDLATTGKTSSGHGVAGAGKEDALKPDLETGRIKIGPQLALVVALQERRRTVSPVADALQLGLNLVKLRCNTVVLGHLHSGWLTASS